MSFRSSSSVSTRQRNFLSALVLLLLVLLSSHQCIAANQGGDDDGNEKNFDDDDAAGGNNNAQKQKNNNGDDKMNFYDNDDSIQYWTNYAILPERCIVYNNVDVVVFSIYDQETNHCSDTPVGTYISPVPNFVNGYLKQYELRMQDQGYDDYQAPDVAQYVSCTPVEIGNVFYYFQFGCADDSNKKLAVNIYSNNDCTTRSKVDGFDDSTLDVSELKLGFKKCQACVNWVNMDEANVDDMFYENRMKEAPLCKTAWTYKETCDRKCQHLGLDQSGTTGWNTSDKILLFVLFLFACIMTGLIIHKRRKMSNKDALLEQAAMSAAGLQQPHVIGICVLVVLVVAVFVVLGLKNITWALLLLINSALFGYVMKLTLDSGVNAGETVIGPDGTILRKESDDSSTESSRESSRRNQGTYMLPTIA